MKKHSLIVGMILVLLMGIIVWFVVLSKKPTAIINGQSFTLYVAKTQKEKEIGLSKYNKLPQNMGMIFIFDKPGSYNFWMRNMKFPIDILFIKDGLTTTIYRNAEKPKDQNQNLFVYQPKFPIDKVLEISAGLSEKYNIKEGNTIKFKNL